MLSKFLNKRAGVYKTVFNGFNNSKTRRFGLIRPSRYVTPLPKRLYPTYVLRRYWELWPLFLATLTSLSILTFHIIWATRNKVDVVFKANSDKYISNTMDLRNPTVHKMFTINQKYEPWPEMQDVLDKMKEAERRALSRAKGCP